MILLSAAMLAVSIIPEPASIQMKEGQFTLTASTAIWTTPKTASLGKQLERYLEPATGYDLAMRSGVPTGNGLELRIERPLRRLGDQQYLLDAARGAITIQAPKQPGTFYAIQSHQQIFPADIFREATVKGTAWTAPAL